MYRASIAVAATLTAATLLGGEAFAQTTQTQPLPSVLAGKKLTPPIRGEALIEWTDAAPKREGEMVFTRIIVRNASLAPVARLTINETYYDKGGANVTAGRGVINGLLQPGEVQVIVIETPWKVGMSGYQRQFVHANGTVKQVKAKLEAPKTASTTSSTTKPKATATAPAATTTAPATTTKKP